MNEKYFKPAVAYARFSSSMQREESIDAQLRAIEEFAHRNGYVIVNTYVDRAFSATSDQRPEFQNMIQDACQKKFEAVIVHKLDRFARSRYDSANYKYQLKKFGTSLLSVTENLDDSPESVVLESVLEGMSEYYSKNLAREVEKGKRENALKGKHVGGTPPLGYCVDPVTRQLITEPTEAAAVKMIFKMFLEGSGYSAIRDELNRNGFKTKRGQSFGKNSLHEILRNEKYTGVYIYNKSSSKSIDGKYNRHSSKAEGEIIRVEGMLPTLISKTDFEQVQHIFNARKHRGGQFKAKENYLLTGKISCGTCGSAYVGNHRKAYQTHIAYTSYRCTHKNNAIRCTNREIERHWVEDQVLQILAKHVFDDALLPKIEKTYASFLESRDKEGVAQRSTIELRLREVRGQVDNILTVIANTASLALSNKLQELELEQSRLQDRLDEINSHQRDKLIAGKALQDVFHHAKQLLAEGYLKNLQALVNRFVKQVTVFSDRIDIKLNIIGGFEIIESVKRKVK